MQSLTASLHCISWATFDSCWHPATFSATFRNTSDQVRVICDGNLLKTFNVVMLQNDTIH